jgi:hypothetical protein
MALPSTSQTHNILHVMKQSSDAIVSNCDSGSEVDVCDQNDSFFCDKPRQ